MKDSFILHTKYSKQISKLTMEQRGVLFTAILCHENGDELPEMDAYTDMAYSFIEVDLNENAQRYDETCKRNAENGMKGGRPKKPEVSEKPTALEKTDRFSENRPQPKKADNDSDNDNDFKEKSTLTSAKKEKHTHGEYKHVRLTDDEYRKLADEYGQQRTEDAITFLDEYIEEKKYKSQSHYLAMRRWVYDALDERKPKERGPTNSQPRLSLGKFGNFQPRSHAERAEQLNAMRAAGVL